MHEVAERLPFAIAAHRERDPLVLADAGKTSVRHVDGMTVTDPGSALAGCGLFDDRRCHQRQHAFYLAKIDMLTFGGNFLLHEAEHQRGGGIESADGIAE